MVHSESLCMVMWAVCDQLHMYGSYCIPVLVLHMCKHVAIHTCMDYVLYAGIICQLSVQICANANMRSCTQHADVCRWMQTCMQTYAGMWTWMQMLYTDIVSRWSWKGQSLTCHLKDCPTSSMQCDLDVLWLHTNLNGKGIGSKSISMNLEVLWTVVQVRCTMRVVYFALCCWITAGTLELKHSYSEVPLSLS